MALKKSIKKSAKSSTGDYSSLNKWKAAPESYEIQEKVLKLKEPLFATSLFANIGIGTSQLETLNIHCRVANELDENRANAHKKLYPSCEMIQGSIADPLIFQQVLEAHRQAGCQIVYASPPCQQATKYNTSKKKGTVEEAMGFKYTLDFIENAQPNYVVIENVPEWLTSQPEIAKDILKGKSIGEYITAELERLQYNYTIDILNAADYGTAENRKRCIVLACKEELGIWKFPKKFDFCPVFFEAIGALPSLKPGDTDEKFKWHYALGLEEHEIEFLAHTATATSAWDNPSFYQPKTKEGNHSGAQFAATYKRLDWNKPCNTITSGSGSISDVYSVHSGRPKSDGTYSDCRTLSILEVLRIIGLADNFLEPLKLNLTDGRLNADDEKFIRTVLGEHVCPRLDNALMTTIPTPANDNEEVEAEKSE